MDASRLLQTGSSSNLIRYPQAHFAKKTDKKKDLKTEKSGKQTKDEEPVKLKKRASKKEE